MQEINESKPERSVLRRRQFHSVGDSNSHRKGLKISTVVKLQFKPTSSVDSN